MNTTTTEELFWELYHTGNYPAFIWLCDGKWLWTTYFNLKRKMLSEYWEKETLKEMETHFNEKIWSKPNWEIYKSYHQDEIRNRLKSYKTNCECGGSFDDVPSKKNRHLQTKKHIDFKNKK